MTEDRSADIRDALREAGISEAALVTAEAEFRPKWSGVNDYGPQDYWTRGGSTTSLRKHAQRYAEAHPFLQATREVSSEATNHKDDQYWPTYANGEKVPASEISADEMFEIQARIDADEAAEARGPAPDYSQSIAEGKQAAAEAMQRDAAAAHRTEQAKKRAVSSGGHATANLPPGVSPEFRSHYESEPTADELFAAAGPDPNPWVPSR